MSVSIEKSVELLKDQHRRELGQPREAHDCPIAEIHNRQTASEARVKPAVSLKNEAQVLVFFAARLPCMFARRCNYHIRRGDERD